MRRHHAIAALTLLSAGCNQGSNPAELAATIEDADVRRVYTAMIESMGGFDGWEDARYFEFTFNVERDGQRGTGWTHHWDRWTGDHRLSGTREGEDIVVIMNVNERDAGGSAWAAGQPVDGARLDSLLTFAYGRWVNDSYWLIMPYKWTDAGVHTTYQGTQTDSAGRSWEMVHLAFDNVGLTPQNEYDAWINPETGLMERWSHYPTGDAEPGIFDWTDWQQFGTIRLATRKPSLGGPFAIVFENVRVEASVPDGAFSPPG
jgi:hypothetical protein